MDDQQSGKKPALFGLGVLFGTIIGGLTALFLSPGSGKENREAVMKKVKEIEDLWEEQEFDKKIKEIFGEVTQKSKEMYKKIKKQVIKEVAEIKGRVEDIDLDKYSKLVSDVVENEVELGTEVAEKLKKQLIADWKKLTASKKKS